MKMDKFCAGLVALVTGLALSAGSALATKGHMSGDPSVMKLVPFYQAGETLATSIGVQNIRSGDNDTRTNLDADGNALDPAVITVGAGEVDPDKDLGGKGLVITVLMHDAMGNMVGDEELCLEQGEFGAVVLHGDEMMEHVMEPRLVMMSMADHPMGYVTLEATNRVARCTERYAPEHEAVGVPAAPAGGTLTYIAPLSDATPPAPQPGSHYQPPAIAAWTIIQDVGTSFFGTEIPTRSITMGSATADDPTTPNVDETMPRPLDCYAANGTVTGTAAVGPTPTTRRTAAIPASGDFLQGRCGLIPERHNNNMVADPNDATMMIRSRTAAPLATVASNVWTRFDVSEGTKSDVFVWLGTQDADRKLAITVFCEEGRQAEIDDPSDDSSDVLPVVTLAAPNKVQVINPGYSDELGSYTSTCEGGRGVLRFMMPDGSHAGMIWTHISQRMDNFRMNFTGYNMADPDMTCVQADAAADPGYELDLDNDDCI